MSEEIDINTNNLCTTEDAFEQFQAISMYEESEFITLPDIGVPQSKPTGAELTPVVGDIPFENEVVLESRLQDQVCEVNSTIESGSEEIKSTENEPQIEESSAHQETPNESQPIRRGRRKKFQRNKTSTPRKPKQSNNTQNTPVLNNQVTSPTRKVGRPRKTLENLYDESQKLSEDSIPIASDTNVLSKRNKRRSSLNLTPSTNSPLVNENVQKSPGKKRGRKKKEINLSSTPEKNNWQDTVLSADTVLIKKSKRGRPKKEKPVDNQIVHDTICNSTEQIPPESQNSNDDKPNNDLTVTISEIDGEGNCENIETPNKISDEDDETDDICLSKLKKTLGPNESKLNENADLVVVENKEPEIVHVEPEDVSNENILDCNTNDPVKRNSKKPIMTDFEYNIDKIVNIDKNETKEAVVEQMDQTENPDESLLVEDTSKRPVRRKARQPMHYDEGSDEDPFANIESSEDEECIRGKKGRKYYSDDDYVPGGLKRENTSSSDVSDIDIEVDELIKQRRKKKRVDSTHESPSKRGRKPKGRSKDSKVLIRFSPEVQTVPPIASGEQDDDIEVCLQSSIIKTNEDSNQKKGWEASSEFHNFIAKKIQGTDIKITKANSVTQPLEIPVIDPNLTTKTAEVSVQTTVVKTKSIDTQTSAAYDIPMKDNVSLTAEQSEKACEFLKSIVKTTSELGELMTQKSEDFIKKKINCSHVTDTFKMDYCVRKSFLLFKLAKHNLLQMEEDLDKQYNEFLLSNNLAQFREKPKTLLAASKPQESDSDCEIIEEPVVQKAKTEKPKPKFNPKTVFLNKELSIKIAKKPSADKKMKIREPNTVWINDSVMVKKVKPTQSFLAQDSRNKKPPDCVTIEMVEKFFRDYRRQQALLTCAPFLSLEWLSFSKKFLCNYFFTSADDFSNRSLSNEIPNDNELLAETDSIVPDGRIKNMDHSVSKHAISSPKSLLSLCTLILQKHLNPCCSFRCTTDSASVNSNNNFNPPTLHCLCVNNININMMKNLNKSNKQTGHQVHPLHLKTICLKTIITDVWNLSQNENYTECKKLKHVEEYKDIILETETESSNKTVGSLFLLCVRFIKSKLHPFPSESSISDKRIKILEQSFSNANPKSLFSLCTKTIQKHIYPYGFIENMSCATNVNNNNNCIPLKFSHKNVSKISSSDKDNMKQTISNVPNTLKTITYVNISNLIYRDSHNMTEINTRHTLKKVKVKTLSDLCFEVVTKCFANEVQYSNDCLTINSVNTLTEEAFLNIEESNELENVEYYDEENNFYEDEVEDFATFDEVNTTEQDNWISQVQMKELRSCFVPNAPNKSTDLEQHVQESELVTEKEPVITNIKIEPEEECENVDTSIVKSEPVNNLDMMTIIPEGIETKSELIENIAPGDSIERRHSYDVDTFEAFVRTNKMMHSLNEPNTDFFSQSALRIRRQHEPDFDTENDMNMDMSLLIPQTYEPINIGNAKNSLMESSGDENNSNKKSTAKKKQDKRRAKPKKNDPKMDKQVTVDKPVSKLQSTNEVTLLTRRMREKIRQEEKKVESSDSEREEVPVVPFKDNNNLLSKKSKDTKDAAKTKSKNKMNDEAIQCNNVDSTEQVNENFQKTCDSPDFTNEKFTGFSSIDQNDVTNYQKYLKLMMDRVLPSLVETSELVDNIDEERPIINSEEPVELLECEPLMPMFDDEEPIKSDSRNSKKISKVSNDKSENITPYLNRNGWHCHPLDGNDVKLYQDAKILLEKLPETFVNTYFTYQNISDKNEDDDEVDRLINLQSLNRSVKENKSKTIGKSKKSQSRDQSSAAVPDDSCNITMIPSPVNSERYDELTPSEDEGGNLDDQIPSPINEQSSENNMAKNLLMNDGNETEDENENIKVKREPADFSTESKPAVKSKPCPKSKKKFAEPVETKPIMLTADKMMNKELSLLHAPVTMDESRPNTPTKGPVTRNKSKSATKTSTDTKRVKSEEDSSSEEEKQWFTIKEKLLKRMINKKDTTREDDAKRAKLVSEFIERRGEQIENYLSRRKNRTRRSTKKMLERQKQLKVLTRELFGDAANDPSHLGKSRYNQASNFKGRRNIRKVIDKKSLAKGTVVANMEEFERKRRINIRQNKLRELLRCEEGVNVLVINDEVCLEYDFEQQRPVVTVHPFFTKVMKAHQYEGVKFMWDACFESLEIVEAGHSGGGCILAHCMGLGKTLQVLALLHTVLTHPRVGMQRVLVVCPLSTVLNWVDEIHKWIGPVTDKIKVFELSKLKKTYERAYQLEDWYNGGGIFIIGYELFRSLTTLDTYLDDVRPTIISKIRTALLDPGPDIIICDEGHLLKNDCSVLAVAMSRVVTKRRIVLTGTPMQNNLREYYCMVNFIKPNLLGTYSEYSNRFENPIMNGQHRDSIEEDIKLMKARTHILHKVLEGCLQRQEASVLYPYLPKKHEYTVFIPLTKCQWDLYKHYMQNYANKQGKSVLKDFHTLQKIWTHPQVLHNFQTRTTDDTKSKLKIEKLEDDLATEDLNADLNPSEDVKPNEREVWWLQYLEGGEMLDSLHSSNKFVTVFRILEECVALGDKLLIFSTSLFTMDALEYFLKKMNGWSLGREYYRLDGSVPAEVRQKWCREFNAETNHKTKLFLISTRAGSLGLNMTAANRVIILDTSWNPAHDIQSIFRVYRFGQKKDCYIYRLVALGTMEQKIYERSVTKQAVACRVLDEQQIDRHYNMADLTELYRYDESGLSVAGGVAVGVNDVALLRVARDASLHAVHEHDSLLRGSGEQGLPEDERRAAWLQFQQEHAHKQMQNDLETQNEKANATVKRVHGHDYAMSPHLKPVVKTEKKADTPAEPKSRKNKNKMVVSCRIPIQPEASCSDIQQLNSLNVDQEEAMVKQITQILLQHEFNNRKGPKEVSNLVTNVRAIVESGRMELLANADSLTASIAQVLLMKNLPKTTLTDIVCVSVNNTINVANSLETESGSISNSLDQNSQPSTKMDDSGGSTSKIKKSKKGRIKKGYVYEEIKPEEPKADIKSKVPDGRRKRRAALAAEKSFDTITDAVIDLDDESDTDFVPGISQQKLADLIQEGKDKESRSEMESLPSNKTKKSVETEGQQTIEIDPVENNNIKTPEPQNDTSILLSDDDEKLFVKKPGPARKTITSLKKKATVAVEQEAKNEPSEIKEAAVSLHPSLLINQNFIKIVAHTYLSGNPMLDEDAAMLAAQYSTQKALKEFESTGRTIESGPLYDIAFKVLGKDVLQKLHAAKPIKSQQANSESDKNTNNSIPKQVKEKTPEPVKPTKPKKPIKLTIKMPSEGSSLKPIVTSSSVTHIPTPTSIIPVGMFRGSEALPDGPQATEECILPDDDDVRIITNPPPPVPTLGRRNSQALILNNVTSDLNNTKSNLNQHSITIPRNNVVHSTFLPLITPTQNVNPNFESIKTADEPEHILSDIPHTISLDSDDEEITPNLSNPSPCMQNNPFPMKITSAQPFPISFTKVNQNMTDIPNATKKIVIPISELSKLTGKNKKFFIIPSKKKSDNISQDTFTNSSSIVLNKSSTGIISLQSAANDKMLHSNSREITPHVAPDNNRNYKPGDIVYTPNVGSDNVNAVVPQPAFNEDESNINLRETRSKNRNMKPGDVVYVPSLGCNNPTNPKPSATSVVPQPDNKKTVKSNTREHVLQALKNPSGKRMCKPGDILRITKDGGIEVLNRQVESVAATNEPSANHEPSEKTHEPTKTGTPKKVQEALNKTLTATNTGISKNIADAKKTTTKNNKVIPSSRSDSSSDPLSILKDVVHIDAYDYDDRNHVNNTKSSTFVGNTNTPKERIRVKPSVVTMDLSDKEDGTFYNVLSHKNLNKTSTSILSAPTRKSNPTPAPQPSTSSKKTNKQVNERIITSVDLTDLDIPTPTSSKSSSSKTKNVVTTSQTIVGKSKEIILSGGNKMSKIAPANATTSKKPQTGPTICLDNGVIKVSTETKKRPVPIEPTPAKKKKTDKPMTLQDFDIDDIDDIIELD